MTIIPDQLERNQALDPTHSFIVQAPAGSGKTALLIQRFLVLLARVEAPEQVVSMTFTRKAAAEMRHRLLAALQSGTQTKPEQAYEQTTWQLARAVLAQDEKRHWQLLENPNRLRILTIDALSARITRYAPLLSRFGANMQILTDARPCYQQAARSLLQSLNDDVPWRQALGSLLLHLDNHQEKLEALFINMLAKRDQWLPFVVGQHQQETLREQLEIGLQHIVEDAVTACQQNLPRALHATLNELLLFAHKTLTPNQEDLGDARKLFDTPEQYWRFIASFLLTNDGGLRKTVTIKQGFPAPSSTKSKVDKAYFSEMKTHMLQLLTSLTTETAFQLHLRELQMTPPTAYSEQQWCIVSALVELLPLLAAELILVFQQQGAVDFIQVSQGALKALGTPDEPTALALNLDYQIQHLLIDEFQDTSISQYHLVELLTAGWQINDGRSIFIVGDPMQSIYRFREAEVGLFLRACHEGIGHIPLRSLVLSTNFRSQQGIVDWCNRVFTDVFPSEEDSMTGSVTYSPAKAVHPAEATATTCHAIVNADEAASAAQVVAIIQAFQLEQPDKTIAILARSRSHLNRIIPALEQAKLPFQAVDIASLAYHSLTQDLFALTKALTHLADRTAWLSILRAPWCGLTLSDLHVIARNPCLHIWDALQQYTSLPISTDGQCRLRHFFPVLQHSLANKGRLSLRDWVSSTWRALGGESCLQQSADLDNAQRYFALLDEVDDGADLIQTSILESKLTQLYASPDSAADGKLQIMTIHRAKGLEFDCVIIPELQKRPASDNASLMLWQARPRHADNTDLILAPIKSTGDQHDPIYRYLQYQEKVKSQNEQVRLLYVAATRAKSQLHLIGQVKVEKEAVVEPAAGSFLALMWPHLQHHFILENQPNISEETYQIKHQLIRLTTDHFQTRARPILPQTTQPTEKVSLSASLDPVHSITGSLIHEALQRISEQGSDDYHQHISTLQQHWQVQLQQKGLGATVSQTAIAHIENAINKTLADKKGQWILDRTHTDAQSEFPLSYSEQGDVTHIIIDRTFIDSAGVRWIIDYKSTTCPDGMPLPTFLAQESERHRSQLQQYKLAMSLLENRETKTALYFPSIPAWVEIP